MLARLRGWFWWRLYALAGRRWERAYDDAHPDQGPTGDAVAAPGDAPTVWSMGAEELERRIAELSR